MQFGEIYLAQFPFGDVPGMKLRPVLLLTGSIGPVPEILAGYISSVVPTQILPSDLILDPNRPEFKGTNLKTVSALRPPQTGNDSLLQPRPLPGCHRRRNSGRGCCQVEGASQRLRLTSPRSGARGPRRGWVTVARGRLPLTRWDGRSACASSDRSDHRDSASSTSRPCVCGYHKSPPDPCRTLVLGRH